MKKETYLKIKNQKRKAKLLGILTFLSLVGCKKLEEKPIETNTELSFEQVEIVYWNGNLYPSKRDNFVEEKKNAFARMSIPIYNSYKMEKEVIGVISEYQTMQVSFFNDEYSYITTEDNISGYVYNELITILPNNYVEMDLSDQWVKVVDNNELVLFTDVVSGKPGHETNIGYTDIWAKTYDRALTGPGYSRDVKYAFFFNDCEEAFHDASWRSEFGGDIYLTNGSLGCANMREKDVRIMDEHTKVGTKVLIHK